MPRLINDDELLYMYAKPGRGYTDQELGDHFEVGREAIFKRRKRLAETMGFEFIETERGRYRIDDKTFLSNLRVSRAEALVLYVAARRLSRSTRLSRKLVQAALEKLALALYQPMTEQLVKAAAKSPEHPKAKKHHEIVDELLKGWLQGRKVKIHYRGLAGDQAQTHYIEPYLVEPSPWSDSVYVIAYSNVFEKVFPFKLERIERAFVSGETYQIPGDFSEDMLFDYAWGIWQSDKPPQTVRLRFTGRIAVRRVQESIWHPHQKTELQPDGSLIWQAEIAEWREMLPWVRGWGSSVTVLAPESLRRALKREARQLAALYGITKKTDNDLIAHWRQRDETPQALLTHLLEASELAEGFAAKVGLPEIGKILGLVHDFGKASAIFQKYLRSGEGLINPDEDEDYVDYKAYKGKIDHSTAGAQLVWSKLAGRGQEGKFLAQFLALALASHHSGLIDCLKPDGKNEFKRRIEKPDEDTHFSEARQKLPMIERQLDEILAQPIEQRFFAKVSQEMKESDDSKETLWFKRGLLARFLLSCLLDADRLNTADFEWPENEATRNYNNYISWDILIDRLEKKFTEFAQQTAQMEVGSRAWDVNQLRAQVAQACLDAAVKPKGIYQLTVPTGGGKTLASLRFALHHAREHSNEQEKIERIFYVVPYITIIDQNAKDVRKVLNDVDENGKPLGKIVLEHHSNFVPPDDTRRRHSLLSENWDAPIVFTTQVQFLEALFSAGTRDARRMHQLANSVIIFDEVQTIPIKITHMFATALRFLVHNCGATVLLCTATQPPLDKLPNEYRSLTITPDQKIIQNEAELFEKLKRVEVHDERQPGGMTNAEIVDLAKRALQEKGSVLIVVNTRAMAQALYQEIKARNLAKTYHLSTNMCPAHRLDKLEEVKAKLEANEPVICVSTQLIEAGVNVDFGAVIRSLAGLDSIAQAAGRCNRHGVREGLGSVWVVNPQEENLARLPDIKTGVEKAQTVLDDFRNAPEPYGNDRIGLKAIEEYYRYYYQVRKNEMDYPVSPTSPVGRDDNLYNLLARNTQSVDAYQRIHQTAPDIFLRQSFQSAGRAFHVIDSVTRGVVVPYGEGETVIADLCSVPELDKQYKLLKKAQQYSVNLYDHQFEKLSKIGAIQEVQRGAGIYYLDKQYYDADFGWSDEPVNSMSVSIV